MERRWRVAQFLESEDAEARGTPQRDAGRRIKPGEELIDGAIHYASPGRPRSLSWGLSVRVKGARRWIKVGVGIGLAEARRRAERLRQDIADGKDPAEEHAAAKQRQKDAVRGLGTLRGVTASLF